MFRRRQFNSERGQPSYFPGRCCRSGRHASTRTTPSSITVNKRSTLLSTHTYTYTVQKTDTLDTVAEGLAGLINANGGDPTVLAVNAANTTVLLTSRQSQLPNNAIALSPRTSTGAQITATASGSYLTGGNAAVIAPGTIVSINGKDLTNGDSAGDTGAPTAGTALPTTLAGAQVFMDGNPPR